MTNLSYCKFRNTARDLEDCYNNWNSIDEDDEEEFKAREQIIALAREICDEVEE